MKGDEKKGADALVKGLGFDPGNYDILYALFAHYMKQGDGAKAKDYLSRLKSYYPNDPQVRDLLARFNN